MDQEQIFLLLHSIPPYFFKLIVTQFEAYGMTSADGEYVEFTHPVLLDGPVEAWLCDVERTMRWTLKVSLKWI